MLNFYLEKKAEVKDALNQFYLKIPAGLKTIKLI